MAYLINNYNGATITSVSDGTIDRTLDVALIGKNYAGYGEIQNENTVFLLENFARDYPPANAITGQLWFDTATKKLKVFAGDTVSNTKVWKAAGSADYGVEPTFAAPGDFWYDTAASQLKVKTADSWVTIGPQTAGSGITQLVSQQVKAVDGNYKSVITAVINNEVVYVIAKDQFLIDDSIDGNSINGFSEIKQGITLAWTNPSTSTDPDNPAGTNTRTNHIFWGTASNATMLDGKPASMYLSSDAAYFSQRVKFDDPGFTVGDQDDLVIKIINDTDPQIENATGASIAFKVNSEGPKYPLTVAATGANPGVTGAYSLGTADKKWAAVYADQFVGTVDSASRVLINDTATDTPWEAATESTHYRSAKTVVAPYSIAARDAQGNISANVFNGTATAARYADLAEKYLADKQYPVGTVVIVGGELEVTASVAGKRALGAVSENPAYMMNKDLEGGTYIALKGRVPVRVNGPVRKGDELVAGNDGCAESAVGSTKVFAIALEDAPAGINLVECVIL